MTSDTRVRGLGFYVPEKVLTNADLEKMVETSDEWITTRTGIKERHIVEPGQPLSDLAVGAGRRALAAAGVAPEELTHILTATLTPDNYCPNTSCIIQDKLGLKGRIAMDLNAACSGFVYGLQTARAFIALDPSAKVLLMAGDVLTSRTNWADRTTCVLFGDGVGAAVLTGGGGAGGVIEDLLLSSDGALADLLTVKGGGSAMPYKLGEATRDDFFIQMNGREVYKNAVRNMESICREIMDKNGLDNKDIDLFVPHQANLRIIEAVGKKLGFEPEKVYVNVDRYGNTSAAAVPIALAECRENGAIKDGDKVLLGTFGGGFTWGSALIQF